MPLWLQGRHRLRDQANRETVNSRPQFRWLLSPAAGNGSGVFVVSNRAAHSVFLRADGTFVDAPAARMRSPAIVGVLYYIFRVQAPDCPDDSLRRFWNITGLRRIGLRRSLCPF